MSIEVSAPARFNAPAEEQALAAQAALLPQALAVFAVCLPIYVWAGSFARNSVWMSATFAILRPQLGQNSATSPCSGCAVLRRGRHCSGDAIHVLSGLLSSGAVWQMAAFANHADRPATPCC